MATITRIMSKNIDGYDRIILEYTELCGVIGMRKLRTYQVYGSSGGTVWHDYNSGVRLSTLLEIEFSDSSIMAKRLLTQYQVSDKTWLDLDNRSMSSLLKNDVNGADVFKIIKVDNEIN